MDPAYQRFNVQLIGSHAVQGRDDAAQDMISATELLGTFYCNHVPDSFYHTDQFLPPHGVGANGTDISICYVETSLTKFDLLPHSYNDLTKTLYRGRVLFEEVQYKPKRGLFANSGKFGK